MIDRIHGGFTHWFGSRPCRSLIEYFPALRVCVAPAPDPKLTDPSTTPLFVCSTATTQTLYVSRQPAFQFGARIPYTLPTKPKDNSCIHVPPITGLLLGRRRSIEQVARCRATAGHKRSTDPPGRRPLAVFFHDLRVVDCRAFGSRTPPLPAYDKAMLLRSGFVP